MFVDNDHAGGKASCRSRSGLLSFVDSALVQLFSKKQSTLEKSIFSTEFVAMKQSIDALRGLRYRLRKMGIPIMSLIFLQR